MSTYLTEDTTFSCTPCGAKFSARECSNGMASVGGHKILSTNAKLFLKGAPPTSCPLIPGTPPPPCTYIPGTARLMGAVSDSSHTHGKHPLLTDKCRWNCGKGGIINVSGIGISKDKFLQGTVGTSGNSGVSEEGSDKTDEARGSASTSGQGNGSVKEHGPNEPNEKLNNKTGKNEEKKTEAETKDGLGKLQKEDLHRVLKCRECFEAANCDKLKELCTKDFITSSSKLKKNYEDAMNERVTCPTDGEYLWQGHKAHKAYRDAKNNEQKSGEKWSYAAHHVLSGGQVVEKNKVLLSLVKAFDYDINNVENCVMLLGKAGDVSFKDMNDAEKNIHKYDCMAKGRLQWHGGHHRYKFNKDLMAKIEDQLVMRKIKNPEDIKCYADLLAERLEELEEKWNRRRIRVCPKKACEKCGRKNSKDSQARQDFFNDINNLAEEIRQELTQFSEKPHRSYPWFVSMVTWIYAFNLVHTSHIIAVTDNGSKLILEKFKLSRYEKTLETTGKTLAIEKKDIFVFNNRHPSSEDIKGCVDFCGNVIFFAIQEKLLESGKHMVPDINRCLGFDVGEKYIFPLKTANPEAELKETQTKLLVWIGGRASEAVPGACGLKSTRLAMARETFNISGQQ